MTKAEKETLKKMMAQDPYLAAIDIKTIRRLLKKENH